MAGEMERKGNTRDFLRDDSIEFRIKYVVNLEFLDC